MRKSLGIQKLLRFLKLVIKITGLGIALCIFIVIILNSKCYPIEIFKINEKQIIVFLDSNEAKKYLSDDSHLSHLSILDIELRLEKSFSNSDSINYNKEYIDHWLKQFRSWKRLDRAYLLKRLKKVYKSINEVTPDVLPDTLYLIRTTGKQEFGAFYTHKKAIVFPNTIRLASTYLPFFSNKIEKTLIHELFHVYTNNHEDRIDSLYKLIGFEKIDNLIMDKCVNERIIHNPDDKAGFYRIKLIDNLNYYENNYCMVILSKHNRWNGYLEFPGHISVLIAYIDRINLHQIEFDGEKWVSSLDQLQKPIIKGHNAFLDYMGKVGLPTELSPEEIIAHLYIDLIYSKTDSRFIYKKYLEYINLLNNLESSLKNIN